MRFKSGELDLTPDLGITHPADVHLSVNMRGQPLTRSTVEDFIRLMNEGYSVAVLNPGRTPPGNVHDLLEDFIQNQSVATQIEEEALE